mgnify:FL=1
MTSLYLGANAKAQAICFALCLAAGVVAGVFALLYFKKGGFFEKVLVDFFATCALGAGFILCVEFFMQGCPSLYGVAAYALGACVLPLIRSKIVKRKRKKRGE